MDHYNWIVRNRTRYTGSSTYGSDYISKSAIIDRPNRNYRPAAHHKPISPPFVSKNVSSVIEFQRWWVLKSKIFGQRSTYILILKEIPYRRPRHSYYTMNTKQEPVWRFTHQLVYMGRKFCLLFVFEILLTVFNLAYCLCWADSRFLAG